MYKFLDLLPDKLVLHLQYYATLGRRLNLKKPRRFTEKVQWYKLNYRDPLMTICADKYRVRDYVAKHGLTENLPKLYGVFDDYAEIDFGTLPNSFAIKSNNGSGTNIFIENKKNANFKKIEEVIKSWKKVNTLSIGREWAYRDIPPKIIVEELLSPTDEFQKKNGLNDYKILCFNGFAKYAWVDIKRAKDHRRNFYDLNWNHLNVVSDRPMSDINVTKPIHFTKMIEIAETFAKDFPFVRVDFYELNDTIYIGELTFYPWSGCVKFSPDSFDFELGKQFTLPFPR